jgi:spermidine synthase
MTFNKRLRNSSGRLALDPNRSYPGVAQPSGGNTGNFRNRIMLFVLFFLSGLAALVYQIAWQRLLGLFGGTETVASALIVSAFLLGLGLGSLWASRFADRLSRYRALVLFGMCELGIALFAVSSTWIFYRLLFVEVTPIVRSYALVFLIAFLSLLIPTVLMGLSLPLLSRAIIQNIDSSAKRISYLYAANTFGAGIGALFAGWFVIGTFGFSAAINLGALISFTVGIGALATALFGSFGRDPGLPAGSLASRRNTPLVWQWSALVFISGFMILSLEILWFRLLGLLTYGSTYAFSLILGIFLIGDALGLFLGTVRLPKIRDARSLFLWTQVIAALYSAGIIWLFYVAYGRPEFSTRFPPDLDLGLSLSSLGRAVGLTILVVLPPAVLLGFSFPLAQKAVQTDVGLVGNRVGIIQVFNIAGNSLGGLLTGLVLLDWVGTSGILRLISLAGICFLIGLACCSAVAWRRPASVFMAAVLTFLFVTFPQNAEFWQRLHGVPPSERILFGEDRTGVVLTTKSSEPRPFFVQRRPQSELPFGWEHLYLGMLGPLTHSAPTDVLVIGSGSGGTPFGAGINLATKHITVVEIVAPVYRVLRRLVSESSTADVESGAANVDRLLTDSRYEMKIGDGRRELFTARRHFDVIEADAQWPYFANSGMLYSSEFFRQVLNSLNPGGMAVMWLPTPRSRATFLQVFPYAVETNYSVAIGSNQPIQVSQGSLLKQFERPEMSAYLRDIGVLELARLRSIFEMPLGKRWRPSDPRLETDINTDLFPKDEYYFNNPFTAIG